MDTKPFKTHEELISLLADRGIDFSKPESRSFAYKALQRIGYYNLINGYGCLFKQEDNNNLFKTGTTIEEINTLYIFDEKMRGIFLRNILPIETNVKSLIAYHFPQKHTQTNYLVYENFDTTLNNAEKMITSLIAEIQRQIANRVSDPSIAHYLKQYGYIPLWVLNNILTFGTVSKFYSLMKQEERQSISKIFHLSDKELGNILAYMSAIRNFCAHGNRLYCYRSKRPLGDTELHNTFNLPKDKDEYIYGKRDLFAFMIASKLMLPDNTYRKLVKDVDIAIKNLMSRTKILKQEILLSSMGFPDKWKELLLK